MTFSLRRIRGKVARVQLTLRIQKVFANKAVLLALVFPLFLAVVVLATRVSPSGKGVNQDTAANSLNSRILAAISQNKTTIGQDQNDVESEGVQSENQSDESVSNQLSIRVGKPALPFPDLPPEPVEPEAGNDELGFRSHPTPPLHPEFKRSTQNPPASIEAMIKAVKAGVPEASKYFWRRGSDQFAKISTVPPDWDVQNGTYELFFEGRGDGGTRRVIFRFTDSDSSDIVDYKLLPSNSGWFIDETIELDENGPDIQALR